MDQEQAERLLLKHIEATHGDPARLAVGSGERSIDLRERPLDNKMYGLDLRKMRKRETREKSFDS
jgi:hypothetical protein